MQTIIVLLIGLVSLAILFKQLFPKTYNALLKKKASPNETSCSCGQACSFCASTSKKECLVKASAVKLKMRNPS